MTHIADKKPRFYLVTRGFCLFLGLFSLLNVVACIAGGAAQQNMNMWWIDLSSVMVSFQGSSFHLGFLLETLAAVAMIWWAIRPHASMPRRVVTCILTASLAIVALLNAVSYWHTLMAGTLYFALPVPLSAVIALIFGFITVRVARANGRDDKKAASFAGVVAFAVIAALVFPMLQIVFFGTTDYRRDADAAVVFGARVYEDGELSLALRERMDTAVELYKGGYISTLIVSGGIEDGNVDEAQAMYNYAVAQGVPSTALLIDRYGDSTELSVKNTIKLAQQYGFDSIIATSSFYHMPRIKMLYNLSNVDVLTVPTVGDVMGNGTMISIWREIPAWWFYWFKGSFGILS